MASPENTTTPTDAELIALVDEHLRRFVCGRVPTLLHDAIEYSLFSGGKRIRPLLCFRACQSVGGDVKSALPAAAAIELIHTFSLVHDDLPAMDDDDIRRGRPTLHKHTNEAMAILAGDAMTALAFKLLTSSTNSRELGRSLVFELSHATHEMICGQVLDTMGGHSDKLTPIQQLRSTHAFKTGALISASLGMGARTGDASDDQYKSLNEYAGAIGIMFQAVDDLLDVTQSTEQVGKKTGKDAAAGKLTYPGLLGVEGTRAEIAKLLDQSLAALEALGSAADPLRAMARSLAERTK